jgi:glycosyltransferase involved in cell wall biosynthesis
VSLSGDDFYSELMDPRHGPLVCEVLRRARRVLVPHQSMARKLEECIEETIGRVDVVGRAVVRMPTEGTDLRRSLGIPRNRFLVLLAGGLRAAKGQHRALSLARVLRASNVEAELILVGPDQDHEYAAAVRERAASEPGVRILPALSHERMGAAYMDADVVLNTSLEEGTSAVILEAGILGRPVVASDIPGNRELLRHKETGLLFADEEGMVKAVLALYRNRSAAGALGVRLREDLTRRCDPDLELDRLLSSYAAA